MVAPGGQHHFTVWRRVPRWKVSQVFVAVVGRQPAGKKIQMLASKTVRQWSQDKEGGCDPHSTSVSYQTHIYQTLLTHR